VIFTAVFFAIFHYSERRETRKRAGAKTMEQFRVYGDQELGTGALGVRPANVLVTVRDPRNLYYLRQTLAHTDTSKQDVVVMTARLYHREHSFSGSTVMDAADVFDRYEQELFTAVVAAAEKEGKPVHLLVIPATDVFDAIVVTAQRLGAGKIVCGLSNKLSADEQAKLTGDAWERLPEPRPTVELEVMFPDGTSRTYTLGPHTPKLRQQDLELLHKIWLEITSDPKYRGLHHYDVIALALRELQTELEHGRREELLAMLRDQINPPPPPPSDGSQRPQ